MIELDDHGNQRIKRNADEIRSRVAEAAQSAGRDPRDITIVPVVKMQSIEDIRALVDAGFGVLGENRIAEAFDKMAALNREVDWHLVGHLQRNKANKALGKFDLIHSVESMELAQKLSAGSKTLGIVTRFLVEVNISGEESKYGVAPGQALQFARLAGEFDAVEVVGFMGVGPLYGGEAGARDAFKRLKEIFDSSMDEKIRSGNMNPRILSMGMTDDFEIAVEQGSTMLRIGRAFFK